MKQLLALTSILGGLLCVGLGFFPPEWGLPGTADYANYELWNRLWTLALLAMLLGFSGFFFMVPPVLTWISRRGSPVSLSVIKYGSAQHQNALQFTPRKATFHF
jgi:hypothetical protein